MKNKIKKISTNLTKKQLEIIEFMDSQYNEMIKISGIPKKFFGNKESELKK